MPIAVVVAADVDPSLIELLLRDDRFAAEVRPARSEKELATVVGTCRALITRHHNAVTRDVFDAAPALEVIVQGTSGLDNIDHSAATERGVTILGNPGGNANAVAELVIGQMIALTRTLRRYDDDVHSGVWSRDDCGTRRELSGYRLGIVGLGRVGRIVARLAAGFGMMPLALDPYLDDEEIARRGAHKAASLEALLRRSDVVTLHVPLTPETRGMIGARELALLPSGAFLINTSRGPVVDLDALLAAIESNALGGAALDVFPDEPPRRGWTRDPRLLLTPHIAGCSSEAKASIARSVYEALCQFYDLEPRP